MVYAVFLTGRPGIGKTTIIMKVVEELKKRGFKVGGMISKEIREKGKRVGFKIIDVKQKREGILAHINQKSGPRVSKYRVNLEDLETIGVKAIEDALLSDDVIIIDEIGKMELFSKKFINVVERVLSSNKVVLGTVHARSSHRLAKYIRSGRIPGIKVYEVSERNKDQLPSIILKEVLEVLKE